MGLHLQVITTSELGTWRECPAKHDFKYRQRLRPKVERGVLRMGTAWHAGVEAGVLAAFSAPVPERLELAIQVGQGTVRGHVAAVLEGMRDLVQPEQHAALEAQAEEEAPTLAWMVERYFRCTATDFEYMVPLLVEGAFEAPMRNMRGHGTFLHLRGKIDLVYYDTQHGDIVLHDHKTCDGGVAAVEQRVEMDPQSAGYLLALEHLRDTGQLRPLYGMCPDLTRVPLGRVVYNVIRRRRPTVPHVNKNGYVSAAAIDTLAEVYEAALLDQANRRGLQVTPDQGLLLQRLLEKGDTFFGRVEHYRPVKEWDRYRREVWADARRIREADRDAMLRTRNPGACTMPWSPKCEYRAVCIDPLAAEVRAQYRVADVAHEELPGAEPDGGEETST